MTTGCSSHTVVDAHAHLVPGELLERLTRGTSPFPSVDVTPYEESFRVSFSGGPPTRPVARGLLDAAKRREWMDCNGIELQLVGGWLDLFGYDLPADEGAEWSATLTDEIRRAAVAERQVVLGTVPLQAPKQAAEALRDQRAAGLPGVMIATKAGEVELSDPAMVPFWEAAHETEAVVFLHPGFGGAGARYHDFGLVNGLGRLEDTTVAMARLLYAGVPATYDRAKILVAHAGAALPYVLGRLVQNHLLHKDSTADPLESFASLYFDSVVFDSDALRFLIGKVGPGRVLMGSDYPFPIGDLEPRAVLGRAGLTAEELAQIESTNALRLIGREHS